MKRHSFCQGVEALGSIQTMANIPLGAVVLGALGVGAAVRTFYHPNRAVVADGFVLRCAADPGCAPAMVIESYAGKAPIFSTVAGRVVGATVSQIMIVSKDEPVMVVYDGETDRGGLDPQVSFGDDVGLGQQVGLGSRVNFSVRVALRAADGQAKWVPNEPAAWLAARGLRVSAKKRAGGGSQWCEGGRKIVVPKHVGECGIRLPSPGAFMLLPVSITME